MSVCTNLNAGVNLWDTACTATAPKTIHNEIRNDKINNSVSCFATTKSNVNCIQSSTIVTEYKILAENKVISVSFTDGKSEKVICDKQDTFDLRTGLYIAISKHLYKNTLTVEGIEAKAKELAYTKRYVKMVEDVIKKHNKELEYKKANEEKQKEAKRIAHEKRMYNDQKKREHKIEIMKEAYLRALQEFHGKEK